MNTDDREKTLAAIPQMTWITKEEQDEFRKGAIILFDLGWPSNYFDFPMIRRAIAGLVPKYEGLQSFTDYKLKWWQIDNDAKAERERARNAE